MIIEQLKQIQHLTHQERAVADTILEHPHDILRMSLSDLAILSYASNSTVLRLCKKLGFKGYPEFKFSFIAEYDQYLRQQEIASDIPFTKETRLEDIVHHLPLIYAKSIEEIRSRVDLKVLKNCFRYLVEAKHIGIYGTGLNFDLARIYQYRFEEVGIPAIAYDADHWQHLARLKIRQTPSFAILITHTGNNPMIQDVAKRMQTLKIPSLLLTGRDNPKLSGLCTETIRMASVPSTLSRYNMTSILTAQYILDILVAMTVVKNFDEIDEVINEPTMNVENQLRQTK